MLLIVFHYSQSRLSLSLSHSKKKSDWHLMFPNHMSSPSLSYNVHPSVKLNASTRVGELSWRHGYSWGWAYWKLDTTFFFLPFFIPFPKGFKLRSLSLSPSCMRGFQSHFVRNWWRWDAKANYRINRTHMFCSTSGTLMAQSLSLTYFSIFVEVTPHTNSIATPINLYHNTYYKLSTYSAQPHQLLFLEKL